MHASHRDIPVGDARTCAREIVLKSVGSRVSWAYIGGISARKYCFKCTESPEKFRNDIDDIRRSLANICDTLSCDDCTKVPQILRKRRARAGHRRALRARRLQEYAGKQAI